MCSVSFVLYTEIRHLRFASFCLGNGYYARVADFYWQIKIPRFPKHLYYTIYFVSITFVLSVDSVDKQNYCRRYPHNRQDSNDELKDDGRPAFTHGNRRRRQ